jgi:DHA1 family inner membrane transport protein
MIYASDAPTLASGANIAAFNLGNALGAWLGGVTISAGLGFTSPIWAGAAITSLALVVMLYAASAARTAGGAQAEVPVSEPADSPASELADSSAS